MSEVVLFSKLRELEEELRQEREVRFRLEKDLMSLRLDLDVMESNYQDVTFEKEREVESNKRLRQDYADLKSKFETLFFETEESSTSFKRKNMETIGELTAHVDALSKSKLKFEKDNKQFLLEIEQLRFENESLTRSKNQAVSLCKELELKEVEYLNRIDEVLRQLSEANESKNKFGEEHTTLTIRIERVEFEFQQISINYKRVTQELDDAKLHLENEIMFRSSVENKLKSAQYDITSLNAQLDALSEERDDLSKQLSRAQEEIRSVRDRCEKDLSAKNEEFEDFKRKWNSKYVEIQEELSVTIVKITNIEKVKQKLQSQVDSLLTDLDRANKRAEEASRHEKQLERETDELRHKLSAANGELDAALQANKNYQIELSKARSLSEQLSEQLELVQKEKRRLLEEVETYNRQLTESHNRILDYERRLKIVESEKIELNSELDDTRDSLQVEITKYQNILVQFEQYKINAEKRLAEKDNELDALRTNHRRQVETLQENIDSLENHYKSEISSIKKKYQIEIEEVRIRYEMVKKSLVEHENNIKRLHQVNLELNDKLAEEQRLHDLSREQLSASDKRAATLRGELEELKTLYERSEKVRKTLELEYHELEVKYTEITTSYNRAVSERRKYESDYVELSETLQELRIQLKSSDERARSATAALAKKDEEIRHERQLALEYDAARKALEQQLREVQVRLEEADEYVRKESKRIASKYESRLIQLETDIELERQKAQEYIKEIRRLEKKCKDLITQVDEEQTRVLSLTESHEKLQDKMKKYRAQIEGAEGQVAVNISRCRRLQRELVDAEERAETMTKTFLRSGSVLRTDVDDQSSSAIEDYSNAVSSSSHHNASASYLRPSYLVSRASHIDDYQPSHSRAGSSYSYRVRYRTVDLDDSDVPATSSSAAARSSSNRYSTYHTSSSTSQRLNNNYQSDYMRQREHSRSRMSTKLRRTLRGLSV